LLAWVGAGGSGSPVLAWHLARLCSWVGLPVTRDGFSTGLLTTGGPTTTGKKHWLTYWLTGCTFKKKWRFLALQSRSKLRGSELRTGRGRAGAGQGGEVRTEVRARTRFFATSRAEAVRRAPRGSASCAIARTGYGTTTAPVLSSVLGASCPVTSDRRTQFYAPRPSPLVVETNPQLVDRHSRL